MIIKSLGRKNKAAVTDLIAYFSQDPRATLNFSHNLLLQTDDPTEIAQQFNENLSYLPERKNGNLLYHEIIALPRDLPEATQTQDVLLDLTQRYIEQRASNHLVYGQIHHTHHPHMHLMISANALRSPRRVRLSKTKFQTIRQNLETYKCKTYAAYPEHHYQAKPSSERLRLPVEPDFSKKRSVTSKIHKIASQLKNTLNVTTSSLDWRQALLKAGWVSYHHSRGEGIECLVTGRRYRLRTLGIQTLFHETQTRWQQTAQRVQHLTDARHQQHHLQNTQNHQRSRTRTR